MSFYRDRIYPHIVTVLGNPEPIHKIRQQLIPMAQDETPYDRHGKRRSQTRGPDGHRFQ